MEELLKAALKKRGYNEGLHVYIKAEKAEDVEKAVTDFVAMIPQPKTYKTLEDAFAAFPELKAEYAGNLQKNGDKRVTEALKKRGIIVKEGTQEDEDDDDDKVTKLIKKAFGSTFDKFEKFIEGQDKAVKAANRKTEAEKLIKEKGLEADLIGFINLDGDNEIKDEVDRVAGLFAKQTQAYNDAMIKAGLKPGDGKKDGIELDDARIIEVAKARGNEQSDSGFNVPKAFAEKPTN